MKKLYIFTILLSLIFLTNVVSAIGNVGQFVGQTFIMDHDTENQNGVKIDYVTATIKDPTHVEFHVQGKAPSYGGIITWFKEIGLPIGMKIPKDPTKNDPNQIKMGAVVNEAGPLDRSKVDYEENTKMGGLSYGQGNKVIFNSADIQHTGINGATQQFYDTITVEITPESTFYPGQEDNEFGGHCAFKDTTRNDGNVLVNGKLLCSAFFFGHTKITPQLSIVKQVSSDKIYWHDDTINVVTGSNVYYKFIVTNTGDIDLSGITLTDYPVLTFVGTIPTTLAKGGSFTVTAGPIKAATGEQTDTATATGTYQGTTVSCSDTATYVGKNPQLSIVKQVSSDKTNWHDDSLSVVTGSNVYYKFIVTNTGDVDLSGITLMDNPFIDLGTIPTKLAKGNSFTVTAGPITAATGEHTDIATATGIYNGQTLTVTDTATYVGTTSTQVPEFPSVVLPVAAILGILIIFGRRKNE